MIPPKLKAEILADPYYKKCCISHSPGITEKIEFHHNLIFAGKEVQEKWCVLPLLKKLHDRLKWDRVLKEKTDLIMLNRGTDEQLKKYSKSEDLIIKRDRLNKKYGKI